MTVTLVEEEEHDKAFDVWLDHWTERLKQKEIVTKSEALKGISELEEILDRLCN